MSGDGFRSQSRSPPAQSNSLGQPCAPFPSKPALPQPPKPASPSMRPPPTAPSRIHPGNGPPKPTSHGNGPPKPISHSDPPLEPASLAPSRCADLVRRPSSSSNPLPCSRFARKTPSQRQIRIERTAKRCRAGPKGHCDEARRRANRPFACASAAIRALRRRSRPHKRSFDADLALRRAVFCSAGANVLSMRFWHVFPAPHALGPVRSVRVHRAAPGPPRPQLWAFCAQRLPHASDVP